MEHCDRCGGALEESTLPVAKQQPGLCDDCITDEAIADEDRESRNVDEVAEELLQPDPCAACDSTELTLLGILGNTAHYRCRACGVDSCRPVKTPEPRK